MIGLSIWRIARFKEFIIVRFIKIHGRLAYIRCLLIVFFSPSATDMECVVVRARSQGERRGRHRCGGGNRIQRQERGPFPHRGGERDVAGRLLSLGPCSAHRGVLAGQNAVSRMITWRHPLLVTDLTRILRGLELSERTIALCRNNLSESNQEGYWWDLVHSPTSDLARAAYATLRRAPPVVRENLRRLLLYGWRLWKGHTTLSHFVVLVRLQPFFLWCNTLILAI